MNSKKSETEVIIYADQVNLRGLLEIPPKATGIVIFAHGSGSSRLSPRNNYVAGVLRKERMGTLLFDLLTAEEDLLYSNRFDIDLLSRRLIAVTHWLQKQPEAVGLRSGYFGASTGSAAALKAAAGLGPTIKAIVSRGGRPDLASEILEEIYIPTLLIVGGNDAEVISLNQQACARLKGEKELVIVPGASHLFEEPGKLEEVAGLAAKWFTQYL